MNLHRSSFTFFLNFIFALFASTFVPSTVTAQEACQTTGDLSCDVYTQCIEANCNCAATSFPYSATFGPKYCQRFAAQTNFSSLGSEWRDKTLICLKNRISTAYVANSDATGKNCDCSAIQSAAIGSHSECYLSAPSFCKLNEDDVRILARIVDAADIFALGLPGMIEMGHVLASCYWNEGLDKGDAITVAFVSETLEEGTELASDVAREVLRQAVNYAVEQAQQAAEVALRRLYQEYFPTGPVLD